MVNSLFLGSTSFVHRLVHLRTSAKQLRRYTIADLLGLPARSTVAGNHEGFTPNPNRPSNPFTPSDEPDWLVVTAAGQDDGAYSDSHRTASASAAQPRPRSYLAGTVIRKPAPPVPQKPPTFVAVRTGAPMENTAATPALPTRQKQQSQQMAMLEARSYGFNAPVSDLMSDDIDSLSNLPSLLPLR